MERPAHQLATVLLAAACSGCVTYLPPTEAGRQYPVVANGQIERPFAQAADDYERAIGWCHPGTGVSTFTGTQLVDQAWLHQRTERDRTYVIGTKGVGVAFVVKLVDLGGAGTGYALQSNLGSTLAGGGRIPEEAQRTRSWLAGKHLEDCDKAAGP